MKQYYYWWKKIEIAKESVFDCAGYLLRTRILIKGANNSLKIAEDTKIVDYDIVVKGSKNSVMIENNCAVYGSNKNRSVLWKQEDEETI